MIKIRYCLHTMQNGQLLDGASEGLMADRRKSGNLGEFGDRAGLACGRE